MRYKPPETQSCMSQLEISNLPSLMRVNNGSSVGSDIAIFVSGTESNLTLNITGIPSEWFSVRPQKFDYVSNQSVTYSIELSAPSDANGTRIIYFQVIGSKMNSSVYPTNLEIVVPSVQTCSIACRGNEVLDVERCVCSCGVICPKGTQLDAGTCLCKIPRSLSTKILERLPKELKEPARNTLLNPIVLTFILLAIQLIWIIPLAFVLMHIRKRI